MLTLNSTTNQLNNCIIVFFFNNYKQFKHLITSMGCTYSKFSCFSASRYWISQWGWIFQGSGQNDQGMKQWRGKKGRHQNTSESWENQQTMWCTCVVASRQQWVCFVRCGLRAFTSRIISMSCSLVTVNEMTRPLLLRFLTGVLVSARLKLVMTR